MKQEDIENIIDGYGNTEMSHYFRNTKNASNKTVSESVSQIIQQTLQKNREKTQTGTDGILPNSSIFDQVIISDLHGNLPGLLTTLNALGFIDATGDWVGKNRNLLQLGDLIDRGPHSWETTFYLRALQAQAREQGGRVALLIGNHEEAVLSEMSIRPQDFFFVPTKTNPMGFTTPLNAVHWDNLIIEIEYMKQLLTQDILSDKLTLASAEPGKDMLVVHAGIETPLLIQFAQMKLSESGKADIAASLTPDNVHTVLKENQIATTDLATWLNQELKSRAMGEENKLHAEIFSTRSGVLWTRSNIKTQVTLPDMYARPPADAFIQLVGHTPTGGFDFDKSGQADVKRVRSIVYTDTGISEGNLSAVGIRGNQIYELTPQVGTWKSRMVLDIDAVRQYDVSIQTSSGYVDRLQSVLQMVNTLPRLHTEVADPVGKALLQSMNDAFTIFYRSPSEAGLKSLLQNSEKFLHETKNFPELAALRKPLKQNLSSLVPQTSEKEAIKKDLSTIQLLRFLEENVPLLTGYHKHAHSIQVNKLLISQASSLLDTFIEKLPDGIHKDMIQNIEMLMHPEGKHELCLRLKDNAQTYTFDHQSIANTIGKLRLSQSHPPNMDDSKKAIQMDFLKGLVASSERKTSVIGRDLSEAFHALAPTAQKTEPGPNRGLDHT